MLPDEPADPRQRHRRARYDLCAGSRHGHIGSRPGRRRKRRRVSVRYLQKQAGKRLCRLNRHGAVVPTFHEPIIDRDVFTIVPALDGTGDIYIGGQFTTYNGQVVNRIARIHADGTLASAGSSTP